LPPARWVSSLPWTVGPLIVFSTMCFMFRSRELPYMILITVM
jgi:hypothetical protein